MTTYISILRGINVSGHKPIKMDALRKLYEQLNFQHVTTYVQSGNVVFVAKDTENKLEQKIANQIENEFGFKVPVIVLTVDKLKKIINNNPFLKDSKKDPAFLHITFLATKPENIDLQTIEAKKLDGEEIHISDDTVYLYCPNGYGVTKLSNSYLETKLKVTATTRNWKTINEIFKIAQQIM